MKQHCGVVAVTKGDKTESVKARKEGGGEASSFALGQEGETKGRRETILPMENNNEKKSVCSRGWVDGWVGGAIERIVFPLGPSLAPARSLRGSPGS